jgi:hypothetical protein
MDEYEYENDDMLQDFDDYDHYDDYIWGNKLHIFVPNILLIVFVCYALLNTPSIKSNQRLKQYMVIISWGIFF